MSIVWSYGHQVAKTVAFQIEPNNNKKGNCKTLGNREQWQMRPKQRNYRKYQIWGGIHCQTALIVSVVFHRVPA